jgi:hypothetical protein
MIPQLAPGRESAHRGLPFIRIVFCLGQLDDVLRGIAQRDQRRAARQLDRIVKLSIPRHPTQASRRLS